MATPPPAVTPKEISSPLQVSTGPPTEVSSPVPSPSSKSALEAAMAATLAAISLPVPPPKQGGYVQLLTRTYNKCVLHVS